jgi:hypothetical protein
MTVAASVGVALPPLLLLAAPSERTTIALARIRQSGERNATTLAIVLLAIVGVVYIGFGLAGLR